MNINPDFGRPDKIFPIAGGEGQGIEHIHQVLLDGTKSFLPLGWRLSKRSMKSIEASRTAEAELSFDLIRYELMGRNTQSLKDAAKPVAR